MRQTFFHELEELERQEKEEKEEKKRIELYLRKNEKARNIRDFLLFFSVLIVVMLAGTVAMYALYLFMNVSRIGNVADVHVTNVLSLASRSLRGQVYNNAELGIKNWMVFSDSKNGFLVRYPDNWKLRDNSEHLFEIRKYNSQASINESLSAAVFIDRWDNSRGLSLEDFVSEKTGLGKSVLLNQSINGTAYIMTGNQKESAGPVHSSAFWGRRGVIYSMKAIFYNQKNKLAEEEFEKIIGVMQIIK